MNIKGKVLFSLLLAVALLVSVIYGLARVIVLRNVYEMEKRYMQVNIERVTGSVLDTLRGLSRTSADWASWDDTYKFVQNGNPDYIQNNMMDETFQNLHLSFMIVVNTSGKIVFRKMFDLFNKKEIEFPVDIVKEIQPGSIFLHHGDPGDEHTGLFMTSEGLLMISSRPILTSNDEGPSEGSFLLGRLFDDDEINRIKEVTRLSFSIFPISRKDLPSDIKKIQSKLLSETESSLVIPSGEDQLSGYALLNDINGKPILIVRVDTPRDIYQQGQLAMDYAVVGLLITGLIFWVITLYILDKVVLSRLAHLNKSIRIIGIGRDLSARLIVKGKDELSGLSREMNTMLAELEQFQIHLRESELKLRTLFENALNPIWMLDQEGRFLEVNHSGWDFFESPAENLITRRFHEFLPPEIMNQTREISLPSGVSSVLERDFLINGRIKTILLNVLQINVGGEELEVYIGQDITDRKRAENDLSSEKERLAVTLRSIGDGVIATDEEGNIRLFNAEAEILTGWTQDEVRGLPLKDIFRVVNEVTGNPCDNPVEATLKTGEMVELGDCTALITRDGIKRLISNRVSPIRNFNGRLIGVVLVFRDITEQHRLEEKIRRTASELTTIFQALPDLYFRLDAKGVVLDWRAGRIDDFYSADPQTFIGTRNVDYLPKEVGTAVQKVMDQVLSTGSLGVVEYALPFGETMQFFEARILPLLEDEIIMVVRNITERQESKKKEQQHLQELAFLSKTAMKFVELTPEEDIYRFVGENLLSLQKESIVVISSFDHNSEELLVRSLSGLNEKELDILKKLPIDLTTLGFPVNSETKKHLVSKKLVKLEHGLWDLFLGRIDSETCQNLEKALDISEIYGIGFLQEGKIFGNAAILLHSNQKMGNRNLIEVFINQASVAIQRKIAEEALRESEGRYRNLVDGQGEGIAIIDSNEQFLFANPAAHQIFGVREGELVGRNMQEFTDPDNFVILQDQSVVVHRSGDKSVYDVNIFRHDGQSRNLRVVATPHFGKRGEFIGTLGVFQDITDQKRAEEQIRYLSFHDKLTTVYNRAYFEAEMQRLDTERLLPSSLIMGDVNNLKVVNDAFGHEEGDRLLIEVARILKDSCRKEDIIARWGGDEFVILLPSTSQDTAMEICERVRKTCRELRNGSIQLSIALGASTRQEIGKTMQEMIREAEDRMYRNKLLESKSARHALISSLERSLWEIDFETEEHASRMQKMALRMGQAFKLPSNQLDELALLATLHDIGKIAIAKSILMKREKLTPEEWEVIKKHPEIGYRIANSSQDLLPIAEAILTHHEWWNGKGYPQGLRGEEIPLISRIISIIDAYDVMIHGRPYKTAQSQEEAGNELRRCSGTQFDPHLVEVFIKTVIGA